MEVDEQSIAQVVVVGKQVAMVFKGDTTVYNAGAFKTMADDRFEELLRQLPGVEIKDNKILAGGEEVKRVLIDGKNFFGKNSQYVLSDLEASDVKSVRVYEELSPEAIRQGNTTARKEKVMNVETKSKRSVLQGGNLAASVGASLEKDYSGRHEIRHSQTGTYYRNSEKGNWRFEASNLKDDTQAEDVSFNSKITPTKQTDVQAEYTYRRGDTTNISTRANFQRRRQSSNSRSMTEYFPTEDYDLRTEENSGESLSKALSASISKPDQHPAQEEHLFRHDGLLVRQRFVAQPQRHFPADRRRQDPHTTQQRLRQPKYPVQHPALLLPHPLQAIVARILGIR